MSRPQKASLKAIQRSCQLALGRDSSFSFRPMSSAAMMRAAPMIRPGMTPALNRSPMEVSAMEPYTTKVMEGGMMTPMAPAQPMRAAEKEGL